MTLDRSYIGYLGFLGIDFSKNVLMYSNGTICLIKLLFKMGLFTVYAFMAHEIFRLQLQVGKKYTILCHYCHTIICSTGEIIG
jgi:hypothetical protein